VYLRGAHAVQPSATHQPLAREFTLLRILCTTTLLPVQLIVLQSRPADDCAVCLSFVRLSLCPTPKWKKISRVHNKLHVQLVGNFWGIKSNKATGHRYIGVFRQVYKSLSLRLAFSFPFLYSPSLELPSFALLYPTRWPYLHSPSVIIGSMNPRYSLHT